MAATVATVNRQIQMLLRISVQQQSVISCVGVTMLCTFMRLSNEYASVYAIRIKLEKKQIKNCQFHTKWPIEFDEDIVHVIYLHLLKWMTRSEIQIYATQ
jgi:hypothetical protein